MNLEEAMKMDAKIKDMLNTSASQPPNDTIAFDNETLEVLREYSPDSPSALRSETLLSELTETQKENLSHQISYQKQKLELLQRQVEAAEKNLGEMRRQSEAQEKAIDALAQQVKVLKDQLAQSQADSVQSSKDARRSLIVSIVAVVISAVSTAAALATVLLTIFH